MGMSEILDEDGKLKVTSMSELLEYRKGALVQLPPFAAGQPFVARLRRPSMMGLMRKGRIPNALLSTAQDLFNGKVGASTKENNDDEIAELLGVLDILCEAMFVEPSFSDLTKAGIELTDEQYTFLFNYSQQGVKAVEPFFD